MSKSEQLRTVAKFAAERHATGGFSVGAIRWQIFNADQNGLAAAGALVRVGRKVFIDPERYDAWLEAQRQPRAA